MHDEFHSLTEKLKTILKSLHGFGGQCHNADPDPEKLADTYNNTLGLLLDRHTPITSKKVIFRPNVPWINSDIIEAKRQRRKAETSL